MAAVSQELLDAVAEANEPEPDDEETAAIEEAETPETPAAPEQEPAMSDRDIEQMYKKLDAEADRHTKRVAEIMGARVNDLIPCPCDWTPGFLLPPPDDATLEQNVAALRVALGGTLEPVLVMDPTIEICPDCNGWGHRGTPSHVAEQKSRPCPTCANRGWKEKPPAPYVAPNVAFLPPPPFPPPTPALVGVPANAWVQTLPTVPGAPGTPWNDNGSLRFA